MKEKLKKLIETKKRYNELKTQHNDLLFQFDDINARLEQAVEDLDAVTQLVKTLELEILSRVTDQKEFRLEGYTVRVYAADSIVNVVEVEEL